MPQRFLRPGITNSERWNSVPFQTQSFYIRILTLVDDFGQYDARPAVLWGQCFQIWNEKNPDSEITLAATCCMLQQLAASSLIEIYANDEGKQFLQVSQWQERVRDGCKRKWPNPEKLQQVAASCSVLLPPSPSPSPSPSPAPARAAVTENKGRQLPEWEHAEIWLADWKKNGADYTRRETKSAFLALSASGWMWGRNPVADPRAALERQIQTDRGKNGARERKSNPDVL